jgi:hypothetical protein
MSIPKPAAGPFTIAIVGLRMNERSLISFVRP